MEITKFKLLNGGNDGIYVEAKEYLSAGTYKIVDNVKRTRKIMLSDELKEKIKKLKYFFLNLTGHWISPYSKYYDAESGTLLKVEHSEVPKPQLLVKDLWNKTEITGAKSSNDGFLLTGKIETVEGKMLGLATPFITEDDDIGFFTECMEILDKIAIGISEYLHAQAIPIEAAKKLIPKELIDGKTKDEIVQLVVDRFENTGAIIMISENNKLSETIKGNDTKLHEGTKNIDGENLPTVSESQDKKVAPFGKPASEREFPADLSKDIPEEKKASDSKVAEDLGNLEHTENMGGDLENTNMDGNPGKSEDEW